MLCKLGLHKWAGWDAKIQGIHVTRTRVCKRCKRRELEEGYLANTKEVNHE